MTCFDNKEFTVYIFFLKKKIISLMVILAYGQGLDYFPRFIYTYHPILSAPLPKVMS